MSCAGTPGGISTLGPDFSDRQTYSAAIAGLVVATVTPTDIFTITGSASKVIRVTRVIFSATKTVVGTIDLILLKRSTANSGGTSTTLTNVPHDSTNLAGTATVRAYTVNPVLGVLVGNICTTKHFQSSAALDTESFRIDFGGDRKQPVILRGTDEVFAVNLNMTAVSMLGNSTDIAIEWTESDN